MLINATLNVNRVPAKVANKEHGYLVVRRSDDATLWYYGLYDTHERATNAAIEIENGIVVKI